MSTLEVNKITPVSGGTTVQIGESGNTINIPSGATLANAGSVTGLPASAISSGTIATARLGSGTASSSTVLYGDGTFKAEPSSDYVRTGYVSRLTSDSATLEVNNCFDASIYQAYVINCIVANTATDNTFINVAFKDASANTISVSRNNSMMYTTSAGTSVTGLNQTSATGYPSRLSIGDNINEWQQIQIRFTHYTGKFGGTFSVLSENWTNGNSQNIHGSFYYNTATVPKSIYLINNAGTNIRGSMVVFGSKTT